MFTYTEDELSLAKSVIASPADDTTRLVMADKLDENAGVVKCKACEGKGKGDKFMRATDWHVGKVAPSHVATDYPTCNGSGWVPDGRAARADFIRTSCQLLHAEKCLNCRTGNGLACFVPTCQTMLKHRMAGLFSLNVGFENFGSIERRIGATAAAIASGIRHGVYWWRGFIEFVRCPFQWWYGVREQWGEVIPGGPVIASAHPVYVDCPDKVPHWNGGGYAWYDGNRKQPSDDVPTSANLPADLFAHLPEGNTVRTAIGTRWRAWLREAEARDAYSVAAVAWARDEFRKRSR